MKKQKMKKQNERACMAMVKITLCITAFVTWYLSSGMYVMAADIGKKAGEWVLDQLFWVGIIALAVALVVCLMKRAWIAAVITGLGGGVILFFIKNAEILSDLGDAIYRAVLGKG